MERAAVDFTSSFEVSYKPNATARVILADGSPDAAIPVTAVRQWPDGSAVALPALEMKLPAPRASDLAGSVEQKPTASEPPEPRPSRATSPHERARAIARPNRYHRRPAIAAAQQVRPQSQRAAAQHMRGAGQKFVTPTRKVETRSDRHAFGVERSRRQISCCS